VFKQGGKVQSEGRTEGELLDAAIEILTGNLPAGWAVEKISSGDDPEPRDLTIKSPMGNAQANVLVEARQDVSAHDVQVLMGGPWRRWRKQAGNQPILLIAPYIGPRVRDLLEEEEISYVDLTGNVRISLNYPGIYIRTEGAQRNPSGTKAKAGLKGAKVGAIVRVLVDAKPPLTGADIARTSNVNEGYVSRVLETLSDEGLIDRESFGPVTDVDWPALLRRRSQALDLFRTPGSYRYVARQGVRGLLTVLPSVPSDPPPTITGSFAAERLSPVASASLLVVYTMNPKMLADDLNLLPSDTGADTILVRPENNVMFARSAEDPTGLTWAAPSQVAIDCLAGDGRMPSEGEAVIDWMREDESRWRAPSIKALPGLGGQT
jgi:hypothetical protein